MNELYWITRLGAIDGVSFVLCILSLIITIVSMIGYFIISSCIVDYKHRGREEFAEEYTQYKKLWEKVLKIAASILIICGLIQIFVPSRKDALLIYGVGGTIDYIKQNPTAKQLPDKCVNALDKWVDSWSIKNDSIK